MTSVVLSQITMPSASLDADNPLPKFWWQQPGRLMDEAPVGLSKEEMEGYISQGRASILPYLVQDNYDRDLNDTAHRSIEINNGALRLTVLPDLGGRLYSMVDLSTGRELLFRNPVFQPANLSLRNAWFSGGIEWNGGAAPGHTASTCETVFTQRVETGRGPILRIHDFDRVSETAWQIDLFLPNGEARCFVHGRIVNPNPEARKVYWWTNTTVPYEPGLRVISPADYSVEHMLPDNHLERCSFPMGWGFDASYPGNWNSSTSVFFRRPGQQMPWLAACKPDGYGLGQISTKHLKGRKYFFFGKGEGGRHWAEYLSEPGKGQYVEIQSGVLPTQNQLMTLAAGASYEWTECFVPLEGCAPAAKGPYDDAVTHVQQTITDAVPVEDLADVHMFLTEAARITPTETLSTGQGWASLHEQMIGTNIADGMDFDTDDHPEVWSDIAAGVMVDTDISVPSKFATSQLWEARLDAALSQQPEHAVLHLFKGIAALDREAFPVAEMHFQKADELSPGWLVARCLAVLYDRQDLADQAQLQFKRSLAYTDCPPQVVLEFGEFLKKSGLRDDLNTLLEDICEADNEHERLRILRAEAALDRKDFTALSRLLNYPYATVREGEVLLSDLWRACVLGLASQGKGGDLTKEESERTLAENPVPFELNFMMKSATIQVDEELADG
ncbi:DUF5107 domain-containing protein [Lentilitoribacter sp. EG35]|uniref:DUF5107 domain-containing protein n=1 Tax=Lentilitoribacter sp. EG35 TaxID=3234192 RepID=UPI0034601A95